ncbi:MAG: hypothetical protein Q7S16_00060, partial [bacterium]|nr:hypothetical protein [bacterium]
QMRVVTAQVQTEVAYRHATEERLCAFWESFAGISPKNGLSVFNLPPTLFLLADVADRIVRDSQRNDDQQATVTRTREVDMAHWRQGKYERKERTPLPESDFPSVAPKQHIFHLRIDGEGRLIRFPIERIWFSPTRERPPEDIPREWVWEASNKPTSSNSYYWKRSGEGEELPGIRIVGSLDLDLFDRIKKGRRPQVQYEFLLPWQHSTRIGPEDYAQAREGYPLHLFAPVLPFLSPVLMPYTLLIGIVGQAEESRFLLLGNIASILPFS